VQVPGRSNEPNEAALFIATVVNAVRRGARMQQLTGGNNYSAAQRGTDVSRAFENSSSCTVTWRWLKRASANKLHPRADHAKGRANIVNRRLVA